MTRVATLLFVVGCSAHVQPRVLRCEAELSAQGAVSVATALASGGGLVVGYVIAASPPCPPCPPKTHCDPCEPPSVVIADSPHGDQPSIRLHGYRAAVVGERYVFRIGRDETLIDCAAAP